MKMHEGGISSPSIGSSSSSAAELIEQVDIAKLGAIKEEPVWPRVRCGTPECDTIDRWGRMRGTRMYEQGSTERYWYIHTCVKCVQAELGVTEKEAWLAIYDNNGTGNAKRNRADKFLLARANVQLIFPMLVGSDDGNGVPKRKIYRMTMEIMAQCWEGLSNHILRKAEVMEKSVKDKVRFEALKLELATCIDMARQAAILDEMDVLEEDEECLAFASREDQSRMIAACTYADTWITMYWPGTTLIRSRVDSFYVCAAKWGWEDCLAVTPSKLWKFRGESQVDATKWDCVWCPARYKGGMGQVVIITRCNRAGVLERFYMKAPCPDWNIEDIRAMNLEQTVATEGETPESLLDKIETLHPVEDDYIVARGTGHKFIDRATWNSLPEFDWYQIFNMVGAACPEDKKKKKSGR